MFMVINRFSSSQLTVKPNASKICRRGKNALPPISFGAQSGIENLMTYHISLEYSCQLCYNLVNMIF